MAEKCSSIAQAARGHRGTSERLNVCEYLFWFIVKSYFITINSMAEMHSWKQECLSFTGPGYLSETVKGPDYLRPLFVVRLDFNCNILHDISTLMVYVYWIIFVGLN